MAVPDYQSCMFPLMRLARDKQEHRVSEAVETLAIEFGLSEEERRELLPSGGMPKFDNRVGWARTYLQKAGLLEACGRARFRITERGLTVLGSNPSAINDKFLLQFPEFAEFKRRTNKHEEKGEHDTAADASFAPAPALPAKPPAIASPPPLPDPQAPAQTPEESLESSYLALRQSLAQDLLDRVKANSARFFERLVVDLLVAMGYGGSRKDAGQAIGMSGDEGIDGIIKEDRLGLDAIYIQAKRWEGPVGRPVVQAFAGSLEGQRARKGVLITTSQFTKEANAYVRNIEKRIVLIDGEQLTQLMIDYGIGVAEVATYTVKRVDADFFGDE